jgi:hypothetical protein
VAQEPLFRDALTSLCGAEVLDGLATPRAVALSALAAVRVLTLLGLTFARIDAPA